MVYVLSDIHGNERRFNSIMEQINLREEDTLYILGDVIDRHPGGIRILQQIMKMSNVHMLLGNHEHMMLRALGYPYDADDVMSAFDVQQAQMLWHQNGGAVTHRAWAWLRENQRNEIIRYLRTLPLNIDITVNEQPYKLVHGAPLEDYTRQSGFENGTLFSVWERLRKSDLSDRDYTLVFGHTPTEHYQRFHPLQVCKCGHGIGIDCGSGYPETGHFGPIGRLSCLRLDDEVVFYSNETTTNSL